MADIVFNDIWKKKLHEFKDIISTFKYHTTNKNDLFLYISNYKIVKDQMTCEISSEKAIVNRIYYMTDKNSLK